MAFHGPADRTIELDNVGGTLTDITSLIKGDVEGLENLEATMEDTTGPGSTRMTQRPTKYVEASEVSMTLFIDEGGSYDARADLADNIDNQSATRTMKVTYSAGKDWACEYWIKSAQVKTPSKQETVVDVVLAPSGDWTSNV